MGSKEDDPVTTAHQQNMDLIHQQTKELMQQLWSMNDETARGLAQGWMPQPTRKAGNPDRVGEFEKFTFPIIRREYPRVAVSDLVGVQPMSKPVSTLFYLKHRASLWPLWRRVLYWFPATYRSFKSWCATKWRV